jgi:hypothetical protein
MFVVFVLYFLAYICSYEIGDANFNEICDAFFTV